MPAISLVVCVYGEGDLLTRLLQRAAGCYDDLVVVHDGPDITGVRAIVAAAGGRFFERPRAFQQEPHWPFVWEQAAHNWILRLDADEFPSDELKQWLEVFRCGSEPRPEISGYTCNWPLWNGHRQVSQKWPTGRNFLIHRQRVRFFGMVEQTPVADGHYEPLNLVLHHQPRRHAYDLANILLRKQAYDWRRVIAESLLGQPGELNCWRWEAVGWLEHWEQIRHQPLLTAFKRLTIAPLRILRDQWRVERKLFPIAALATPLHHVLICLKYWQLRRLYRKSRQRKNCC